MGRFSMAPEQHPATNALAKRYFAKYNAVLAPHHVTSYAMCEIFHERPWPRPRPLTRMPVVKLVEKTKKFETSFGPFVLRG